MNTPPNVLTIAGSDSSGGAGIQADIKTFTAIGVYGASAITNITAQNTCEIETIFPLPVELIHSQLSCVFEDIHIDAVKIGMLNTIEIINVVAEILQHYQPKHIVLDPVLISTSGKALLQPSAIKLLCERLFPLATIITPNVPEAIHLLSIENGIITNEDIQMAAKALSRFHSKSVLLKGGHLSGKKCTDTLWNEDKIVQFSNDRIDTKNTHGSGCTLSSAIAAYLALGNSIEESVRLANAYLYGAIKHADNLNVGLGHGPVNHFFNMH